MFGALSMLLKVTFHVGWRDVFWLMVWVSVLFMGDLLGGFALRGRDKAYYILR